MVGVWPCGPVLHLCAHMHRRRQRHGLSRRLADAGFGVRAVPPQWHLPCGLPADRGLPWSGRHLAPQRGRAFHGTLRPHGKGLGLLRRRESCDDLGGPPGRDILRPKSHERLACLLAALASLYLFAFKRFCAIWVGLLTVCPRPLPRPAPRRPSGRPRLWRRPISDTVVHR